MTRFSSTTPGTLYVVATPIGNVEDITHRAIKTLQSVDTILAEDTRHSSRLLHTLGIKKPLSAFHAHNEAEKSQVIIEVLLSGASMALISDAGTPLINDPGYPLVKEARSKGINVAPIPGACALITALSAAGIPCDTFTFVGFLPAKQIARQKKLHSLEAMDHTLLFYESTHRILECLDDVAYVFGQASEVVLAKELSKAFERFVYGTCMEVKAWLLEDPAHEKGEFVVMIPPRKHEQLPEDYEHLLSTLLSELPLKQAVKLTCEVTGQHKNEVYKRALEIQAASSRG